MFLSIVPAEDDSVGGSKHVLDENKIMLILNSCVDGSG
jgi:hypothetical protein